MIALATLTDPVIKRPINPVVSVAIILHENAFANDLLGESKLSPKFCRRY